MTNKDNINKLIVKKLTDGISEEENKQLNNELKYDKPLKRTFKTLSVFWNQFFPKTKEHSIIQQTEKKLGFTYGQSSKTNNWKWIGIAASILLVASLSFSMFYISKQKQAPTLNEYFCNAETIREITLSDGTRVWLNSSSLLIASEPFVGEEREVSLFGEAYFEVAHNEEQPFVVETVNLKTKVLGTHFNVVAYPSDEVHEISLYAGKVQLNPNKNKNTAILNPGERAYFSVNTGKMRLIRTDLGKPAQWRDGILRFYDEALFSITKKLERHFLTRIFISDSVAGNLKYTGEFEEESLERILELLSAAKDFNYKVGNNGIIIESK